MTDFIHTVKISARSATSDLKAMIDRLDALDLPCDPEYLPSEEELAEMEAHFKSLPAPHEDDCVCCGQRMGLELGQARKSSTPQVCTDCEARYCSHEPAFDTEIQ